MKYSPALGMLPPVLVIVKIAWLSASSHCTA
jgi:hypothetical protein